MEVHFNAYALALQFLAFTLCTAQYEPPKPTILPLFPHGIQIFIPDGEGISLVAVHAKINEDFEGLEAGTIARDIVKVKNNRWTYQDRETRLKIGDTVYLWIHVVYNGLGYNLLDQNLRVTEFFNPDGTPHPLGEVTPAPTPKPQTPDTPIYFPDRQCFSSATIHNRQQHCIGDLLFEDHFNGNIIHRNKWRVVKEIATTPDYEFVVYQDNGENLNVRDGELRIKPTLFERQYDDNFIRHGNLVIEDCTGIIGTEECQQQAQGYRILPPVASGLIDTKNSFNFIYGRVEIRAKLPRGDWIYPVLSLHPVSTTSGAGYPSGQLRIASVVGNRILRTSDGVNFDGHVLRAGAVVSAEGPMRQNTMSNKTSDNYWSDDYHIYELQWSPTKISVQVDGQSFGEKDLSAGQNSPFDKSFYLKIGVAVGGHGEFPDASVSGTYTKPWRNPQAKARLNFYNEKNSWANTWEGEASTLKVDYIKIWAI